MWVRTAFSPLCLGLQVFNVPVGNQMLCWSLQICLYFHYYVWFAFQGKMLYLLNLPQRLHNRIFFISPFFVLKTPFMSIAICPSRNVLRDHIFNFEWDCVDCFHPLFCFVGFIIAFWCTYSLNVWWTKPIYNLQQSYMYDHNGKVYFILWQQSLDEKSFSV